MNKKLLSLLLGTFLVLAACSGGETESTTETTTNDEVAASTSDEEQTTVSIDVEKKYQQKCSMCHGINLDDGRGNVPELATVGSRLSKEEIEKVILEGAGTMPKEQLVGEEAAAVAEWLAEMK